MRGGRTGRRSGGEPASPPSTLAASLDAQRPDLDRARGLLQPTHLDQLHVGRQRTQAVVPMRRQHQDPTEPPGQHLDLRLEKRLALVAEGVRRGQEHQTRERAHPRSLLMRPRIRSTSVGTGSGIGRERPVRPNGAQHRYHVVPFLDPDGVGLQEVEIEAVRRALSPPRSWAWTGWSTSCSKLGPVLPGTTGYTRDSGSGGGRTRRGASTPRSARRARRGRSAGICSITSGSTTTSNVSSRAMSSTSAASRRTLVHPRAARGPRRCCGGSDR